MNPDFPSCPTGAPGPTPTSESPASDWPPPFVPNTETIEAMEEARRGELLCVTSIEELFAVLNADNEDEDPDESPRSRSGDPMRPGPVGRRA